MNDPICHFAPLGMNIDWIKEGLFYFNWNYLVILITPQKKYIELANKLKEELLISFNLDDKRILDVRIIKEIEILNIDDREISEFLKILKNKARVLKQSGYKIYFNATSGLELWKFAAYFIAGTEDLIDKFYYIPKDTDIKMPIKPIEIYRPIQLPQPLIEILKILNSQLISQKSLVKKTKLSKGLISRYLKNLRNYGLIMELLDKPGKEKYYNLTEKGKWYL